MRIYRLLAITVMLLNRSRVNAKELAEYFEVSIRTIYRDIDAINLAGIPIVSYPGNNGGFGILDNYKLDSQLFTFNDIIKVLSTLKGGNETFQDREIDSAIEKITSLVPADKSAELEGYFEQVVIDVLPWGFGEKEKAKLQEIHKALADRSLMSILYRNARGETGQRVIEPMTLVFKGYSWYLFAFCRFKNDFRLFKISRMTELVIMEEGFTKRDASYKMHNQDRQQARKTIKLLLKFDEEVRYRLEEQFEDETITYQPDGSVIIEQVFPEDDWIYSYILSFGEYAEVLGPDYVREEVLRRTKELLKKYE